MLGKPMVGCVVGLMILLVGAENPLRAAIPQSMDQSFVTKAATGGKMEVELGRVAAKKGHRAAVRSFGHRMVMDHTKAGNKLKMIAKKRGIVVTMDIDAEERAKMDQVSQLSGEAFDRAYMEMMVDDHEKDVAEFQTEASSGGDADIKAFAAATLPTLKSHLRMAKATAAKVK